MGTTDFVFYVLEYISLYAVVVLVLLDLMLEYALAQI